MINSEFLDGEDIHDATVKVMDHLEEKGWGERVFNYHLRDWLISRQRYWGPPIPMVYCESCAKEGESWFSKNKGKLHEDQSDWEHAGWYPEEQLPVELPELTDYQPKGDGKGPLGSVSEFYETKCPACSADAKREVDVSDTFVDSAWYFLRYPSVDADTQEKLPFDPQITKDWLPVNLYFGGAEHSVLHLMYARFVTMVLHDTDYVNFEEPFPQFYAHGLMIKDGTKMSKSKGNVVNPDAYIEKFGADTLRLYLMFMGPMDGYPDFRDTGIEGMGRFMARMWDLFTTYRNVELDDTSQKEVAAKMHATIKKVTEDIKGFRYNTAIAAIMGYVNLLREKAEKARSSAKSSDAWDEALDTLVLLIAPFSPHMAEEVWVEILGNDFTVHKGTWPEFDSKMLVQDVVTVIVQVNGKVRAEMELDVADASDEEKAVGLAKDHEKVTKWIEGKDIKHTVFVPWKLVNFVV